MEYEHANDKVYSDWRLSDRLKQLVEIDHDWQNAERRKVVQHELACITFEQMSRYAERRPLDVSELEEATA